MRLLIGTLLSVTFWLGLKRFSFVNGLGRIGEQPLQSGILLPVIGEDSLDPDLLDPGSQLERVSGPLHDVARLADFDRSVTIRNSADLRGSECDRAHRLLARKTRPNQSCRLVAKKAFRHRSILRRLDGELHARFRENRGHESLHHISADGIALAIHQFGIQDHRQTCCLDLFDGKMGISAKNENRSFLPASIRDQRNCWRHVTGGTAIDPGAQSTISELSEVVMAIIEILVPDQLFTLGSGFFRRQRVELFILLDLLLVALLRQIFPPPVVFGEDLPQFRQLAQSVVTTTRRGRHLQRHTGHAGHLVGGKAYRVHDATHSTDHAVISLHDVNGADSVSQRILEEEPGRIDGVVNIDEGSDRQVLVRNIEPVLTMRMYEPG